MKNGQIQTLHSIILKGNNAGILRYSKRMHSELFYTESKQNPQNIMPPKKKQ